MKALNTILILFNLLMIVWSVVNIYGEYSSIWMFNLIQSVVFLVFWVVLYTRNRKFYTK